MRSMNIAGRVYMCGLVAALVVLLKPAPVAASDSPTVRVTRPVAGRIVLDVADASVAIQKEVTADRSVVTITTEEERLSLTVRRGVLTVSGPGGTVSMDTALGVDAQALQVLLRRSDASTKARKLLARITDGPNTFAGQSMLLTRAVLEMGTGSAAALNEHQRWAEERAVERARPGRPVARPATRPAVIRAHYAAVDQLGPGDCWDLYQKEAIRIAEDFDDCTEDLKWYEAHLWAACSLIYAVRSEGAMAWFISCNGGVPFKG